MKRGSSIAFASMLATASLAGCSSTSGGSAAPQHDSNAQGVQSAQVAQPANGQKTFTMLTESHPTWPYQKDWSVWKMIEGKTGVTLNMQIPSGKLEDTVSLNVASGSMPDITYMKDLRLANKYGQQGALANVLDYGDVMPNFNKWAEKNPDVLKSFMAADGKLYMLPNQGIGETNRMVWLYREDLFKQLGLTPPKTFDELYDVLKALKKAYPNSYPFAFRYGDNPLIFKNLSPAFNTNEGFYYDDAAKQVKYGPTEDSYKTMITYMAKLYKEGLIPPDWLTEDTKQWQDLISTNKAFITIDYIGRIDFFNVALRKSNPQFSFSFMAPPAGPGGKQLNSYTHTVESGMTVASGSKQVIDIMKYLDFFYSDEGKNLMSWGIDGVNSVTENGKKKMKPEYIDVSGLRKKTGLGTNGTYTLFDYDAHLSISSPELQAAYVEARKYDNVLRTIPPFLAKEQETISTVGQAVDKHREENIARFILGTQSLDDWNKYVDGTNKLGLPQLMDLYKTAFERAAKGVK